MSRAGTVLIVEDDRGYSAELAKALEAEGLSVVVADGVTEAERLIAERAFDLVLLDLVLGEGGDGFKVLEVLRRKKIVVPVIVLSGYVGRYVQDLANFYSPLTIIINKPCPPDAVVTHVHAALSAPAEVPPDSE